ncbi:non-canonical purine NTP pyrophosphatase [Fluviispira vulneris]|uniref:non-canonical purine NTP pyrophosphatase n=1 Tax=Fluviispira vulneris TaxID=2763012 RepID=UPI0016494F7C|nr:non-canonical purine NTP pyrophosphatase [Fluviispira vulneris]
MSIFICTSNQGKLREFSNLLNDNENIVGLAELKKVENIQQIEAIENSDYFLSNALIKILSALKYILDNHDISEFKAIKKILVDDSGLCVPELNYLPGVHSATYAGEPKSDEKNRKKLTEQLNKQEKYINFKNEKRLQAFFVCFLIELDLTGIIINKDDFKIVDGKSLVNNRVIELERNYLDKVNLNIEGGSFSQNIPISSLLEGFNKEIYINIHYGFCSGEISNIEQNKILGTGHGYDHMFYSCENRELSFASIPLVEKNRKSHRAFALNAMVKSFSK